MATPEQERNTERLRRGMATWASGDVDGTLSTLTEDVEVVVPAEVGNPGTFRGHDEVMEWMRQWDEAWEEFESEIAEVVPVGERHVVATMRQSARGRGSGVAVDRDIGWVVGFRGELCEFLSLQETPELGLELARTPAGS